jgi:uncharacterized Zn finger protein (UPF0148 family)
MEETEMEPKMIEYHCPSCDKKLTLLEGSKYCSYCKGELVRPGEMRPDPEFEERLSANVADKLWSKMQEQKEREQADASRDDPPESGDKDKQGSGFLRG